MSDLLANLALGFGVAAQPYNILFCLLGALVGTLVGVLPGIGTVATIAMLLLLRVVDPVRWTLAIPIAVLAPLGMWWVLKRLLLIQLPSGMLEIG